MQDTLDRLRAALQRPGPETSDHDLNPGFRLPENRRLRSAAVLVAVLDTGRGPEIVLTRRSPRLEHHPGQIAFPGGKQEPGDPSPEAAALREAHEEIGLHPDQVQLLGTLPAHETVTGFSVTPVLAHVDGHFSPRPQVEEVAEVFRVPFAHVADPARYAVERRMWQGQWRHYYAVPYGPYYIWGATARILRAIAGRLPE